MSKKSSDAVSVAGSVISESFCKDRNSTAGGEFDVLHISGHLLKKSSEGEWQRRYFETNGSFLTYYKSQKMTKLLAALSLPQVGKILLGSEIEDTKGKGVVFTLELKDRQYTLRALNREEAQRWIDVLVSLRDGVSAGSGTTSASESRTPSKAHTESGKSDSAFALSQDNGGWNKTEKKTCSCCVIS